MLNLPFDLTTLRRHVAAANDPTLTEMVNELVASMETHEKVERERLIVNRDPYSSAAYTVMPWRRVVRG